MVTNNGPARSPALQFRSLIHWTPSLKQYKHLSNLIIEHITWHRRQSALAFPLVSTNSSRIRGNGEGGAKAGTGYTRLALRSKVCSF